MSNNINNQFTTELFYTIFTESSLTCLDLIKIRTVCHFWNNIISTPYVGRLMFRKINRVLLGDENWLTVYKQWATTFYWIVIDRSSSMCNQADHYQNRDIHDYDESSTTPYSRAEEKAQEIFNFLTPVSIFPISVNLFNEQSACFLPKNIEQLNNLLSMTVLCGHTSLESALEEIIPFHKNRFAFKHRVELFILSDFRYIYEDITHDLLQTLAKHTHLKVNCVNLGFFKQPNLFTQFNEDQKGLEMGRIYTNYAIDQDGFKRTTPITEEPLEPVEEMEVDDPNFANYNSDLEPDSDSDYEPPVKKQKSRR